MANVVTLVTVHQRMGLTVDSTVSSSRLGEYISRKVNYLEVE